MTVAQTSTFRQSLGDFLALTKPRVLALIMLTALVGAALAAFDHADSTTLSALLLALLGVALLSAGAAAFNCLTEIYIDRKMRRTDSRPLAAGRLSPTQALLFASVISALGLSLTALFGGWLLCALTALTFFGYTVVYTVWLKHRTPQNIVIGGASGAMPPVLGWVAVTGQVSYEPLLLFLIIFVWTPPHFWALALYRRDDYAKANIPMLPVTHGTKFTAEQIVLYSIVLFAVALLPFVSGMAGWFYLAAATVCNARFVYLAWQVKQTLSAIVCRRLFVYSITYLSWLFAALVADRALMLWW